MNPLAIFGASPIFDEPLHVGRPNIGNRQRFLERVNIIMDTKRLANDGPFVQEFERQIAMVLGVKHCVAACNGTIALEIAARAVGLHDEVIVPSFTFVATAHALQWQRIVPVFCDVDPQTHCIDPSQVEEKITPRTSGIIGVHLWGRPCEIDALTEIARRHGLKLIFDASQAFGSSYKGNMIGGFGEAEVLSFHATKFVSSGEGGAVVTNSDEIARELRLLKNFGFSNYDSVDSIGTNGKMSEISAAFGLSSLECLEEFIAANLHNYKLYREELRNSRGIQVIAYDETEKSNFQYVVIEIDEGVVPITRDQFLDILWAENILARRYFYPGIHHMEPYHSDPRYSQVVLRETDALSKRVLCLPTGTAVEEGAVKKVCSVIRYVIENADYIRTNWDKRKIHAYPGFASSES